MKRGRKTPADLTVVKVDFPQRADPPPGMMDSEAAIWRETIASEPVDFFATAALRSMLSDYCRHRASADSVSSIIATFKPEWLKNEDGAKRFHALLRMREMETRAAASMATKLRLTNQSRYFPQTAARAAREAAKGIMPWDD